MNILYIIHNLDPEVPESQSSRLAGGCEHFTYKLARKASLTNTCYILYPDLETGEVHLHKIQNLRNEHVQTISDASQFVCLAAFGDILDTYHIDVIHYQHLIYMPLEYVLFGKARGIRQLLSIHDYFYICEEHFLESDLYVTCSVPESIGECGKCLEHKKQKPKADTTRRRKKMQQLLQCFDAIYVPSKSLRSDYFKVFPEINEKLSIIPIGVDPLPVLPIKQDGHLHVGILNYLTYIKGVVPMTSVIRMCEDQNLPIKFHILSDSNGNGLERYLTQFSNVVLDNKNYRAINLAWLPTIAKETFSIVTSECLFRGTPILACNKGAIGERLNKELAFLYAPEATVEDIFTMLKELANNLPSLDAKVKNILAHREQIPTIDFVARCYLQQYQLTSK